MLEALGTSWPVLLAITGFLGGFVAYMTGRAISNTWGPLWQVVAYGLLLGAGDRFLSFALFQEPLLSVGAYIIATAWIVAVGTFSYKLARADRMVRQYPWLYERRGLFGWSDR
jgi:hypothetical protein